MTTQELLAKIKQYPLVTGCLVLIAILGGVVYFRGEIVPTLTVERDSLESQWSAQQFNEAQSVNLDKQVEELEAMIEEIDGRAMKRAEKVVNEAYFYQAARHAGVSMMHYGQEDDPDLSEAEKKAVANERYEEIGFDLNVRGKFEQVTTFVHTLRTGRHFVRLDAFDTETIKDLGPEFLLVKIELKGLGLR